ncbi:MAG: class I SAM-dependent methyltransferase [Actinomycetota bacterium]|nr:class I SAM-dependent methyltransferase [Actinomycetota bacterium]
MSTSSQTQYTGLLSPFLRDRRVAAAAPHLSGRVLDVGCADGPLANLVPADRYVGVDVAPAALEAAREAHPDHTFMLLDELGADERFDTIASLAVIEHIPQPVEWLSQLAAHLAEGGSIVLTTPHRTWEPLHDIAVKLRLASHEASDEHETTFNEETLREVVEAAGLQLTAYSRFLLKVNQLAICRR